MVFSVSGHLSNIFVLCLFYSNSCIFVKFLAIFNSFLSAYLFFLSCLSNEKKHIRLETFKLLGQKTMLMKEPPYTYMVGSP